MAKVLIACEESQAVTIQMRKLGIEAYSCDILPCSGGYPEFHLQQDVTPLLQLEWDMIIAFPPCTHIAISGARWFNEKRIDGRQQSGVEFFMQFTKLNCQRVAIENPVGIMSSIYRKPDQIIHPYYFGDPYSKKTCLWLKNLPPLAHTNIVDKGEKITFKSGNSMAKWYAEAWGLPQEERQKIRSKTFRGIAEAMAEQWGKLLFQ